MTNEQKLKIQQMRQEGQSYKHIASTLGISENTIKSYCRRNNFNTQNITNETTNSNENKQIHTVCKQCEKPLVHTKIGQSKKFCCDECRRKWWKLNESQLTKKAYYSLTCSMCGKTFESYGNKNRKFCTHSCYIAYRYYLVIKSSEDKPL